MRILVKLDALSYEQANLVIKKLAQFHTHFWHAANNIEHRWLNSPIRQLEDRLDSFLAVPLIRRGLRQAEQLIPEELHQPAEYCARHRKAAMRFLNPESKTLAHHDCHPVILFWHHAQPGFLDWQLVRWGKALAMWPIYWQPG